MDNPEPKKSPDQHLESVRSWLMTVKRDMPDIWHMITTSNCCPHELGLKDTCGFDRKCEDCWLNAIQSTISSKVSLSKNSKYMCSNCREELVFKQITAAGKQHWFCPKCKSVFEISLDDANLSRVRVVHEDQDKESK